MKSKIKFKVLMLLLLLIAAFQAAAQPQGDVNGDGRSNISDVTALIHYILSGETSVIILENADVNADGVVNISDVTTLIHLILFDQDVPVTETFTVEGVSFTMVHVEGGTFTMGSNNHGFARPEHEVTLSDFYIGQTEVTQELWLAVMGVNPSWFSSNEGYEDDFQRPVEEVRWYDCQDFIAKLNRLTGRTFRLPTEAEWEFAAHGGNNGESYLYAGSNNLSEISWYKDNVPSQEDSLAVHGPQRVGLKKPNALGLYDMTGNVYEWCQDWFDYYSSESQINPTGPETGQGRIMKGGSWRSDSYYCKIVNRGSQYPSKRFIEVGLRLAL